MNNLMNNLKNVKVGAPWLVIGVILTTAVFSLAVWKTEAAITGSYLNEDLRVQRLGEVGGGLYVAKNQPAIGFVVEYGDVGIGTTSPGYLLHVNGTAAATAFVYASDEKLKKNVKTLDSSLDKILQLRGVSFDWIKDGEAGIGLIAQEVEQVFPVLVSEAGDTKSVHYANLVAPLIEAIKEQQAEIDSLEARIKKLEAIK
ncbi:MAG: hypothetical protein UV95_C0001G0139 [Candidatus Falkowbacteria bacterium GW2011_GWF2_43_32]|nr:MAG: hypothetical protein UV95_C0001G0139 [Candidatus Falkowbacteria bacterium GW2011_GWF2_43_32]